MTYLLLFWEFLKIGLFAVGGGLAALPFLSQLPSKYDWFTMAELANMVAVAESTPGPVGINMATYAGYQAGGLFGGMIASIALVLPSICIATLVCSILARYSDSRGLRDAFSGLRPAVAGLITAIALSLLSLAVCVGPGPFPANISIGPLLLFLLLLPAVFIGKKHPVIYIAIGAAVGMIFKF